MCDGCLGEGGRKCPYCDECAVRACALERGMANCAHCEQYACDTLLKFFEMAPEARESLDQIRATF